MTEFEIGDLRDRISGVETGLEGVKAEQMLQRKEAVRRAETIHGKIDGLSDKMTSYAMRAIVSVAGILLGALAFFLKGAFTG